MAITWQEARTKVRGDLWRPGTSGVPDDVCDRALHASLLEIESQRRWLWLQTIVPVEPLAANAAQFPKPANARAIVSIAPRRTGGELDTPLELLTIGRIRVLASETLSDWPAAYALSNGIIYLDCEARAGTAFEAVILWQTPDDIPSTIATAETNPTIQLHQSVVIAGACAEIARTYLKNDAEEARQQRSFDRGIDRLMNIEDDARADETGGLIQPDTSWQEMAHG